jgi:hypothetical protein
MLCVEGQISSYSADIQFRKIYGSSAGNYQFFASEDLIAHKKHIKTGTKTFTHIDGDEMNFRMAVLSGFRGRHVHNFAGTA